MKIIQVIKMRVKFLDLEKQYSNYEIKRCVISNNAFEEKYYEISLFLNKTKVIENLKFTLKGEKV
jgi:hypothetical protein